MPTTDVEKKNWTIYKSSWRGNELRELFSISGNPKESSLLNFMLPFNPNSSFLKVNTTDVNVLSIEPEK